MIFFGTFQKKEQKTIEREKLKLGDIGRDIIRKVICGSEGEEGEERA